MALLRPLLAFGVIGLSSRQIGQLFTRFRLPMITGYLFAGIIAGPFVLDFISEETVQSLHFLEQISLAVIAFAAGSELYIHELRSQLRSIAWVTVGLSLFTHVIASLALFLMSSFIPFMRELPAASRLAAAILVGPIMIARSPSSAIAIVNELRARGPFTRTVLGVTVVMDLVVIVIFAIDSSLADTLISNTGPSVLLLFLLLGEILLALLAGFLLGRVLTRLLMLRLALRWKAGLIVLAGYGVFVFSDLLRDYSHRILSVEIFPGTAADLCHCQPVCDQPQ